MKKNLLIKGILCSALVFMFASCVNDVDLADLTEDFAIDQSLILPLGSVQMTVNDLLDSTDIDHIGRSAADVYYEAEDSTEFSFRQVDLSSKMLPYTTMWFSFGSTTIPANQSKNLLDIPVDYPLGVNSDVTTERIDSVKFTQGVFSMTVRKSDFAISPSNIEIITTFPNNNIRMLNSGSSPTMVFRPSAFDQPISQSLSNFVVYTVNGARSVPLNIQIRVKAGSAPVSVTALSKIQLSMSFTRMDYSVIYGKFQPSPLAFKVLKQEIDLSGTSTQMGLLRFANPQFFITARSNVGVYLSLNLDYLKAYCKKDDTFTPVFAWFDNKTSIKKSVEITSKPAKPGLWVKQALDPLNSANGGTDQFFDKSVRPDIFESKYSITNSNTTDAMPDFLTPDARIKVGIMARFPLYLNGGSNYTHRDTILNVAKSLRNDLDSLNSLKKAKLVLKVKNGFPVAIAYTMKFLSSTGKEITYTSDIKRNYEILSASVDAVTGYAQSINEQSIVIELNESQVKDLQKADKILFDVKFSGQDATKPVHIRPQDSFSVKVGVYGSAHFTNETFK